MVAVAPIIPKRKIPQIFMFSSLLSSYGLFGDGLALSLFRLFPSSPLISSKFRKTNSAISSQLVIEFEIPNTWFRVYPFLSWIGFFFFFFFFPPPLNLFSWELVEFYDEVFWEEKRTAG